MAAQSRRVRLPAPALRDYARPGWGPVIRRGTTALGSGSGVALADGGSQRGPCLGGTGGAGADRILGCGDRGG